MFLMDVLVSVRTRPNIGSSKSRGHSGCFIGSFLCSRDELNVEELRIAMSGIAHNFGSLQSRRIRLLTDWDDLSIARKELILVKNPEPGVTYTRPHKIGSFISMITTPLCHVPLQLRLNGVAFL